MLAFGFVVPASAQSDVPDVERVVVDLNPLHFEDELVRHKILDVIGDLRLAGKIRGHVIAAASGHALNTQLAKVIAGSLG